MRRASAAALIFCAAGCASASVAGFGSKAALGWTLGGEVHLFLVDSESTRGVYGRIVRAHLAAAPASFDSAVARRPVVTLAAESLGAHAAAHVAAIPYPRRRPPRTSLPLPPSPEPPARQSCAHRGGCATLHPPGGVGRRATDRSA